MNDYLESIGGLENGMYSNKPKITSCDFFDVQVGWYPLIKNLIDELITLGWDKKVTQVKEKFGTLRVYHTCADEEEIYDAVKAAESLSALVCEETGVFNETVGSSSKGWIKTLAKDQAGFNSGWHSRYDDDLLAILEEIKLNK